MTEDETLSKIYHYLELDTVVDRRLQLKADLMKKIISLTMQWKEGYEAEWIDKLANRCSLSIRKIRENYLDSLATDGILTRRGGYLTFVGLPDNAVMPCELTPEQFKEELEEENEQRAKLGKPKVSFEEWKSVRPKRLKPLK